MIEIIPAIDIIDGKCVRLSRGDYDTSKIYSDSPADMARRFADAGVRRIHLVDLDGARSGRRPSTAQDTTRDARRETRRRCSSDMVFTFHPSPFLFHFFFIRDSTSSSLAEASA